MGGELVVGWAVVLGSVRVEARRIGAHGGWRRVPGVLSARASGFIFLLLFFVWGIGGGTISRGG